MQNYLSARFLKKSMSVILFFCIFTMYPQFLYALQNDGKRIDISFNAGDVGFGALVKNNTYIGFASFNLFNLYIENDRVNLGLKLSPLYYEESRYFRNFSLLNADIYWNPFPKAKKIAMMVPFVSVNYFTYDKQGTLDMSDIIFSAGWRFVYIGRQESMFRYDTYAQIGCRYFDNRLYYYLTINLDITILAVLSLMSLG